MGKRFGVFEKGLVILAVPFLFQLVFIAALGKSQADSRYAQQKAVHTKDVIAKAESASRLLAEAQVHVRGLVLTGDPAMSAAYLRTAPQIPHALAALRELMSDNAPQQARVDAFTRKIEAFTVWVAETHRLAKAGRMEEATARFRDPAPQEAVAAIREDIKTFLGEEERLDADRRERLRRALDWQSWAIALGAAASVLIGVAMLLAFSQGFAARIAVMSANAARLAEGKALAAPLAGTDELSQLDRAFHSMANALAEKDQENEMFIYSVSHDLRSPLVNLQGFSKELLLTRDDLRAVLDKADVPAETRRAVETLLAREMDPSIQFIQSAVMRLSSIIDALLRLSRAGRVIYRREAVDVQGTVARVVEAIRSTSAERRAEIVVGDLPPAWGDPTAIEQVFANLIANALAYLDPHRPGRIEIGTLEDGAFAAGATTYYVKDNGLGIPKAHQAKLFTAFQRLHPTVAQGEGIGLALVKRIVERQGGKIWAESDAGQGSTFHVTLPAAPSDSSRVGLAAALATVSNGDGNPAASENHSWPSNR